MNKNTLVVNLIGGSGIGKSSNAALLFGNLKKLGIDAELVQEFAKQLVWEEREKTFSDQLYIFSKQNHKINMINDNVEVIVTDCPLIISTIFLKDNCLKNTIINEFNKYNNLNIVLERIHEFQQNGRREDENGAIENDQKLINCLNKYNIPYHTIKPNDEGMEELIKIVMEKLDKPYEKNVNIKLKESQKNKISQELKLVNSRYYNIIEEVFGKEFLENFR